MGEAVSFKGTKKKNAAVVFTGVISRVKAPQEKKRRAEDLIWN